MRFASAVLAILGVLLAALVLLDLIVRGGVRPLEVLASLGCLGGSYALVRLRPPPR